ncbi:hypothetical protein, partial [Dokdonella sp.]|uniref:hypothetical protein n=1 Tax=Dokdonella sp. TaxID=2291710 RepID=UPI00378414A6
KKSGARNWISRLLEPVLQPKFAMGMAMTILSFSMLGRFAGIEPRARYVAILRGWGDDAAADALVEDSLRHVSHMPASARELNREWIRQLRQDSRQAARTAG